MDICWVDQEVAIIIKRVGVWVSEFVQKVWPILNLRSQSSVQHVLAVLAIDEVVQGEHALV